jgi:hypothetical protein
MNRAELQLQLDESGVDRDAYSIDRDRDETYCLTSDRFTWSVYYSERGLATNRREFTTEHDACRFLFDRLLADPTTQADQAP